MMVYDEIDLGISGKVADHVGAALSKLSRNHQVLVITHLPQIASQADHHLLVSKSSDRGTTLTTAKFLTEPERVKAIAALIAGVNITDKALASASELLRVFVLGWWERIGSTSLSGIPKLMLSEARNFPELADFYYKEVIQRGEQVFRRALERGIESGEFRRVDIGYAVQVLLSPIVMLSVWRHSLGYCQSQPSDPLRYLETYLDLALAGLRSPAPTEKPDA